MSKSPFHVRISAEPITRAPAEIVVIGFFEDTRPFQGLAAEFDWWSCGLLSSLVTAGKVTGRLGEALLFFSSQIPAGRCLAVGLGPHDSYSCQTLHSRARFVRDQVARLKLTKIASELWGLETGHLDRYQALSLFLQGIERPGLDLTLLTRSEQERSELARALPQGGAS